MTDATAVATYDPTKPSAPIQAHIVDVSMPFGSMVTFMVKWAVASIPAVLILMVIAVVFSALFAGMLAGLLGGLR